MPHSSGPAPSHSWFFHATLDAWTTASRRSKNSKNILPTAMTSSWRFCSGRVRRPKLAPSPTGISPYIFFPRTPASSGRKQGVSIRTKAKSGQTSRASLRLTTDSVRYLQYAHAHRAQFQKLETFLRTYHVIASISEWIPGELYLFTTCLPRCIVACTKRITRQRLRAFEVYLRYLLNYQG